MEDCASALSSNIDNTHINHEPALDKVEVARRMKWFRKIAFGHSDTHDVAENVNPSDKVVQIMQSMLDLSNNVLTQHNASCILTRTEEDEHSGTRVYMRISFIDESQEQTLLEILVRTIQRNAPLLRPEIVESQLDGTLEVRMQVPSADHAKQLAWVLQRDNMRRSFVAILTLMVVTLAVLAYLFHSNATATHSEL